MGTSSPELPSSLDVELESGTVVGEYTIESKLGQGAFGTVYKGVHPLIGKVAAIKVLARKLSADDEMVSRFQAEARAVNQIHNKHIIDIFAFGALEDGRRYYVMEYLDGEPLDALIDRVGNLPISEALPILRAVAKALDAAHAKGIAHRDLKAENIFLGRDSDGSLFPKLLDFGIAKLMAPEDQLKHKTRTGAPIGTPYYMSPEQCRGKDVDHRTDIYAFGVLMYRMLSGQYPFDGDDYMSILMKQIMEEPPALVTHLPDVPAAVDDAVLWALAKEPADRPPDLRTAVRALEEAAQKSGVDIGPPVTWDVQSTPGGKPFQTQPPPRRATTGVSAQPAAALTQLPTAQTQLPALTVLPPQKKSKAALIAIIAAVAVVAVGIGLFVAGGKDKPPSSGQAQPPSQTAEVATPPTPPSPTPAPPSPTPAPPSPPPETAPAAAPQPARVKITVVGASDDTEVLAGTTPLGLAANPIVLDRGTAAVELTLKRAGYATIKQRVVPDTDQTIKVIQRRVTGGRKPTGNKDDGTKEIEDPFK